MIADTDLQVWLDSQHSAAQTVVIPYVKSIKDRQLDYRLIVVHAGRNGSSRISQGGMIKVSAANVTPLSRVVIAPSKEGECRIEVTLREGEQEVGNYRFDCPR